MVFLWIWIFSIAQVAKFGVCKFLLLFFHVVIALSIYIRRNLNAMSSWNMAYWSGYLPARLIRPISSYGLSSCNSLVPLRRLEMYLTRGANFVLWVKYLCLNKSNNSLLCSINEQVIGEEARMRTGQPNSDLSVLALATKNLRVTLVLPAWNGWSNN